MLLIKYSMIITLVVMQNILHELLEFIDETYKQFSLPLDIVYTGKLFFAIKDLAQKSYFEKGSKLLMIHSRRVAGKCFFTRK